MAPEGTFSRIESLVGAAAMERLSRMKVAVVGVGGVGGWAAVSLARSGVGSLVVVDGDCVEESNVNRQPMAFPDTVGRPKAEVLSEMLKRINPMIRVEARHEMYEPGCGMDFSSCDYVVDAIDQLHAKAALIRDVVSIGMGPLLVSSMGAALRLDSTKVRLSKFSEVVGDPLAKSLKKLLKTLGDVPDFDCAWSCERPMKTVSGVLGSAMPVTAAFGHAIASLVLSRTASGR